MATDQHERTALQHYELCETHPTHVTVGLPIAKPEPGKHRRGDLMRQIAALYAQTATGFRRARPTADERQELVRQIVALERQLMKL
jgi:hypothetical protein